MLCRSTRAVRVSLRVSLIAAAAAIAGFSAAWASPGGLSVAINFAADEAPGVRSDVLGAAGVLGTETWNNVDFANGGPTDLNADDDGTSTPAGVSVTWTSNNTWSSTGRGEENNTAPAGDDRNLMTGYLDTTDTSVTMVTVAGLDGLTTQAYSVYVYVNGGVTNRGGTYTIGAEAQDLIDTAAFDGSYVETENYLLFAGVTGDSFTLTATPTTPALFRAPVNGIEVVTGTGAVRPKPVRQITPAADAAACPPSGLGPITVRISQELEQGANPNEVVAVTEVVKGLVYIHGSDITAENGGTVTDLPQDPISPVGAFADHRNVVTNPICTPTNGNTVEGPAGVYTLTSSGEDVWVNGDTFQYAYNAMRGDFDVQVTILDRTPAALSRWGKHGIMARQDLTTRSRYTTAQDAIGRVEGLGVDVDNNDDSTMAAGRRTHGGNDNFEIQPYPVNPSENFDDYCDGVGLDDGTCTVVHHDYLRLTRVGNVFTAYSRGDPAEAWGLLGSHDWGSNAPQDVLVGLYATSHSTSCVSMIEIQFGEWTVNSGTTVPVSLPGIGAKIDWNVTRQQLVAGVQYAVGVTQGLMTLQGTVGATDRILGPGSVTLNCDTRVTGVSCKANAEGGADTSWTNHPFADPAVPITITVNGAAAATVPGNSTSATIPAGSLADGFNRLCVLNSSGLPACCTFLKGNGINVSDLIAGGDGSGSADPSVVGINPDTGVLETAHNNNGVPNTGNNPQAVDPAVAPYVDSVFILDQQIMAISSAAVTFEFGLADATAGTYSHIIKDLTHSIDGGVTEIWAGGINTWVASVGIHASAGITLNLTKLRQKYGELGTFSCFAGGDQCGGDVSNYAITSDGLSVLDAVQVDAIGANTGGDMELEIPAEATFLTLATGAYDGDIGCDHGVFANAKISLAPTTPPEDCDNGIDDDGDTKIDCTDPDCTGDPACPVGTKFYRGDADGNGSTQLTDAVRILNNLFLGTGVINCSDAADSDDNGSIQLTDAVRVLNVLFLGTGQIPPPGGATPLDGVCGLDTTDDALDCASYPQCAI